MLRRLRSRLSREADPATVAPAPVSPVPEAPEAVETPGTPGSPGGPASSEAADALKSLTARADEGAARLAALFDEGAEPEGLRTAYADRLAVANELWRRGDRHKATRQTAEALLLAFHRGAQTDRLTAPLTDDPSGFTEPLRESLVLRAATAPRGRATTRSRRGPATEGGSAAESGSAAGGPSAESGSAADRPQRLLFVTFSNAAFLGRLVDHSEARPGVETRFLDLAKDEKLAPLARGLERILGAAVGLPTREQYLQEVEEALRPHLDWADTVFVEWCALAAAFVNLVDPRDTRVVVRLHKYETFTYWPQLMDFTRVDDLVFIADHVLDLTVTAVPRLTEAGGPRLHNFHNALELSGFLRPKADEARFTVGLVGIGQVAKDPVWAMEVIRLLRAEDPRYRLVAVGSGLNPAVSAAARRYHEATEAGFAELEATGAVERTGQVSDIPGLLERVGVILSSSVREGCHVGLMEGAASSAVPVVRDWPMSAGRPRSARTLFPEDWMVTTPQEAAERVLAVTADPERWRALGAEAAKYAAATWDWSVVQDDYDRLLFSPAQPG